MRVQSFLSDESGAVTVDWVVLTGLVALLALPAVALIRALIDGGFARIVLLIHG